MNRGNQTSPGDTPATSDMPPSNIPQTDIQPMSCDKIVTVCEFCESAHIFSLIDVAGTQQVKYPRVSRNDNSEFAKNKEHVQILGEPLTDMGGNIISSYCNVLSVTLSN